MAITLDEMSSLAAALLEAQEQVKSAEELLKLRKEATRVLAEETIPSAMQELGLESLTLETGQKLSVKQEVYASIASGNKSKCYDWLDEHGFGGLIKSEVTIIYGRDEIDFAKELVEELQERDLQVSLEQSVHAQTLKAFLKEQLANGAEIPLDMFGARPVFQTVIKQK